ncbi:MAG: precorrin-2 C(20)-methyltransferase [Minwuia sp.]|uniref:precorrin-2 C(20)-methyltransferase n=1 Tax=Minwuia sp. TaxID=2493630 RepID=UPI003A867C47
MTGSIHGVGVGPGDPELMTLKAQRVIGAADAVFYISADGKPSRALATARKALSPGVEEVPILMPMRADPAEGAAIYDSAAEEIAERARHGQAVAVLCEGDPLLYGSFLHLLERLRPDFEPEVVPGIPSFLAAAAAAATPLVRRTESVSLLPGTLPKAELAMRLAACDCAAILKTGKRLPDVRAALEETGMADDALVIEEATTPAERIRRLAELEDDHLPYFALILAWRAE